MGSHLGVREPSWNPNGLLFDFGKTTLEEKRVAAARFGLKASLKTIFPGSLGFRANHSQALTRQSSVPISSATRRRPSKVQ
jgi:hypothetical protein